MNIIRQNSLFELKIIMMQYDISFIEAATLKACSKTKKTTGKKATNLRYRINKINKLIEDFKK